MLYGDSAEALGGGGQHPLHADDAGDALLDAARDVVFDLALGGAGIGHGDDDGVRVVFGEPLDGHLAGREQAAAEKQQHQYVGGNAIVREVGD